MTKNRALIVGAILLGVVVVGIAAVWFLFLQDTEEASGPITSVPIEIAESPGSSGAETSSGVIVFRIDQAESEARFTLGELLRGEPTTVVGATDQVAGEIAVDPADPAAAQVGVIQINARTLATDNSMRNRAIGNRILQTDSYEFITFTPTAVEGLPGSITVGEPFSFRVTGELTIRDIANEETFEVTVTPVSEARLEGLASTTVQRADYGLTIPSVPSVADVDEEVLLELEFVATAGGQ